ncbi:MULTISPECIES: DUF3231 family protein [Priestia]|nr:DUF3231 family protein [Priestia megaterium]MCF8887953.1 DUF3231 family protein [Priestia megaterium]
MNNQSFSPLSAAEMAVIWKQYMNDKAISCMLKQFLVCLNIFCVM